MRSCSVCRCLYLLQCMILQARRFCWIWPLSNCSKSSDSQPFGLTGELHKLVKPPEKKTGAGGGDGSRVRDKKRKRTSAKTSAKKGKLKQKLDAIIQQKLKSSKRKQGGLKHVGFLHAPRVWGGLVSRLGGHLLARSLSRTTRVRLKTS